MNHKEIIKQFPAHEVCIDNRICHVYTPDQVEAIIKVLLLEQKAPNPIDNDTICQVIKSYGYIVQVVQIQEECQELALAIHKLLRRSENYEEKTSRRAVVIDEIADVKIMMAQAEILFPTEEINERIKFKMERLKQKLNKYR